MHPDACVGWCWSKQYKGTSKVECELDKAIVYKAEKRAPTEVLHTKSETPLLCLRHQTAKYTCTHLSRQANGSVGLQLPV